MASRLAVRVAHYSLRMNNRNQHFRACPGQNVRDRVVLMKRLVPVLLLATAVFAQTAMTNLADIRKIYIEPMPNNLNQYLTSEISKQFHGSLTVVLQQSDADAIMKG